MMVKKKKPIMEELLKFAILLQDTFLWIAGFKKLTEFDTTRPSRIHLDADRDEFDTRYLDSALNRLDSDDSTDIPS